MVGRDVDCSMSPTFCALCLRDPCNHLDPECARIYAERLRIIALANGDTNPPPHANRAESRRSWQKWRRGQT